MYFINWDSWILIFEVSAKVPVVLVKALRKPKKNVMELRMFFAENSFFAHFWKLQRQF